MSGGQTPNASRPRWRIREVAALLNARAGMTGEADSEILPGDPGGQPENATWFTSGARYWLDVYGSASLEAETYRRRLRTSLKWIDEIGISQPMAVLDAGCGAGELTLALAGRGARVVASDLSIEMTRMTLERGRTEQWDGLVIRADAHRLPFPDGAFGLVVALGLLPWVRSPQWVVTELARVTQPGGHVLLSFDNSNRLFRLTDPKLTPAVQPLRRLVRRVRGRPYRGNRLVSPRQGREIVASAGLHVTRTTSVGFGPPTFLARPVGPQSLALAIDAALQRRADGEDSVLSRLGAHYLVLARRKPLPGSPAGAPGARQPSCAGSRPKHGEPAGQVIPREPGSLLHASK